MSDTPQGPGWWQASDGKWYPPEQAPGAQPASTPAAAGTGGFPEVGEAFSYAWAKFQANVGQVIVATLVGFAITAILTLIGYFLIIASVIGASGGCEFNRRGEYVCDTGPGFLGILLAWAVFLGLIYFGQFLFDLLMIRVGLLITAGRPLEPSSILSTERVGPYLIGSLIMAALATLGFFLCFIPGILVLLFGRFFGFYVLDKSQSPVDAIKSSFNLVKDNFGTVIVFLLAVLVANWLGAFLCYVGLIVTMPVTAIATAYFYRRAEGQPIAA
ncbi:MAG: hypothetical protein WHS89_11115 [Acidimicrobiales bacterium]